MLFINGTPTHVVIRSEVRQLFDTKGNLVQPKAPRVWAKFRRGAVPEFARAIGEERFDMTDRPPEVTAAQWLCAYDSLAEQVREGWSDEVREMIEADLLERGYLSVAPARLDAPYPMYDKHRKTVGKRTVEHAIRDITAAYESAGFNVDAAVAYEAENLNDPLVIAALSALTTSDADEAAEAETVIAA